jgi:hypothetical protein
VVKHRLADRNVTHVEQARMQQLAEWASDGEPDLTSLNKRVSG